MKSEIEVLDNFFAGELSRADEVEMKNKVSTNIMLKKEYDFMRILEDALILEKKQEYLTMIRSAEQALFEDGFFIDENDIKPYLENDLPNHKRAAFESKLSNDVVFEKVFQKHQQSYKTEVDKVRSDVVSAFEKIVPLEETSLDAKKEKVSTVGEDEIGKVVSISRGRIGTTILTRYVLTRAAGLILLASLVTYFCFRVLTPNNYQNNYQEDIVIAKYIEMNSEKFGAGNHPTVTEDRVAAAIVLIRDNKINAATKELKAIKHPSSLSHYFLAWCAVETNEGLPEAIEKLNDLREKEGELGAPFREDLLQVKILLSKAYALSGEKSKAERILKVLNENQNNAGFNDKIDEVRELLKK